MIETIIQAVPSELGQFYCPTTWQQFYLDILARTVWKIPGEFKPFVISPTQPSVDDQDKVWFKTVSTGAPIRAFLYDPTFGWISPHPVPAAISQFLVVWRGTQAQLDTYDGGSVGAVGPITGPFWEFDPDWADKFPIGVGPLAPNVDDEVAVFAGFLHVKEAVRAATTTNKNILSPGAVIDGVSMVSGDRVLVKDQTVNKEDHGIYTWNGPAVAMTRTLDADSSPEVVYGTLVNVEEGTINGGTNWILTTPDPIVLNTTPLAFTLFDPLVAAGPKGKAVHFIRRTARLYYTA